MAAAKKFDIYKEFAHDFVTSRTPVLVDIKPANYLAVTGRGEPAARRFNRPSALFTTWPSP